MAEDLAAATQALTQLQADAPALVGLEALARLLLRSEAVGSSRIEGLEVGARRLVRAEAARMSGELSRDVTAEAVLGNVEAMQEGVELLAKRPAASVDDIRTMHRLLMRRTDRPALGGVVRTEQNWIGGNGFNPCGAEFVPPPPEYVFPLLDDLVAYLNDDEHPPLVQAALAHLQFETIHPFADGNGRIGRALIHVVLRRRDLATRFVPPISLILATRSSAYIRSLSAARYLGTADGAAAHLGLAEWLRVFASATTRASNDAVQFGQQIENLVAQWKQKAQPVRANSSVDRLLAVLPGVPIVTVATAARLIGRSVQSTNVAVNRLVTTGVLLPTRAVKWGRAFEAAGVLDALTGFERALASPSGNTREAPPVRPVPARAPSRRKALGEDLHEV